MEEERINRWRTISFTVVIAVVALIVAGCSIMLAITTRAAQEARANPDLRKVLVRLALLSASTLGLALMLLLWSIMRFVGYRFQAGYKHHRTPYVNAWAVAGERFRLDDDAEDDGTEDEDGEDEDGPDLEDT